MASSSKAHASLWGNGKDYAVQTDQRALIDKILARYAGEYSIFRELIQNADDAGAKNVEVHFESEGEDVNLSLGGRVVGKYVVKNDGGVFRDQDWGRLEKIADGNPDIDKIGAFGVGFYSVFSITESPFVGSGDRWMGFYWNRDQLVARSGHVPGAPPPLIDISDSPPPTSTEKQWTIVDLPLRQPGPLAAMKPFSLVRFLAHSITFLKNIECISVFLDTTRIAKVAKRLGESYDMELPIWLIYAGAPIVRMQCITRRDLGVKVEVVREVYRTASAEEIKEATAKFVHTSSGAAIEVENAVAGKKSFLTSMKALFHSTTGFTETLSAPLSDPVFPLPLTGNPKESLEFAYDYTMFESTSSVAPGEKMIQEMVRATKKRPPESVKVQLVYSDLDNEVQERWTARSTMQVAFKLSECGKIFIGHSTAQITGTAAHIGGPFIPTAERESLDMIEPCCRNWNNALLYISGALSRVAYTWKMGELRDQWSDVQEEQTRVTTHALRVMNFFHVQDNYLVVARSIYDAFSGCSTLPLSLPVITSRGICEAGETRRPSEFSALVKRVPILHERAPPMRHITLSTKETDTTMAVVTWADVLEELKKDVLERGYALEEEELAPFLDRLVDLGSKYNSTMKFEVQTHAQVKLRDRDAGTGFKVVTLSQYIFFISKSSRDFQPPDTSFPLPSTVFPSYISRLMTRSVALALGCVPLTMNEWVRHILSDEYFPSIDVEKATKLLHHCCDHFRMLGRRMQPMFQPSMLLLQSKAIIPIGGADSAGGLVKAGDAYLANSKTMPCVAELPMVHFEGCDRRHMRSFLLKLGVNRHASVQVVLDKLYDTGRWDVVELTRFLASIRNEITPAESSHLLTRKLFNKCGSSDGERFIACELYEPNVALEELGLPVLKWPRANTWRSWSSEGKLLAWLGMRKDPDLNTILNLASSSNVNLENRGAAFQYFFSRIRRYKNEYKWSVSCRQIEFVPCYGADGEFSCKKPYEVYADAIWTELGFWTIDPAYRSFSMRYLEVTRRPSLVAISQLIKTSPPSTVLQAEKMFQFLSEHFNMVGQIGSYNLATAPIVPVLQAGGVVKMCKPSECYLSCDGITPLSTRLFVYAEYSPKAGKFLRQIGAQDCPTADDLLLYLAEQPHQFKALAGGNEGLLEELSTIAEHLRTIKPNTIFSVSQSSCLLGRRKIMAYSHVENDLDEDSTYTTEFALPERIVIVDDIESAALFADSLLTAPSDASLHELYMQCGSPSLRSLVTREPEIGKKVKDATYTDQLRSLVLSRLSLYNSHATTGRWKKDCSWLYLSGNFKVKSAKTINSVHTLQHREVTIRKRAEVSSAVVQDASGPLTLWVTKPADMYDVADSLLANLLENAGLDDTLILASMLQSTTAALRRRGYRLNRKARRVGDPDQSSMDAATQQASTSKSTYVPNAVDGDTLPPFPGPAVSPPQYTRVHGKDRFTLRGMMTQVREVIHRPSASTSTSGPLYPTTQSYSDLKRMGSFVDSEKEDYPNGDTAYGYGAGTSEKSSPAFRSYVARRLEPEELLPAPIEEPPAFSGTTETETRPSPPALPASLDDDSDADSFATAPDSGVDAVQRVNLDPLMGQYAPTIPSSVIEPACTAPLSPTAAMSLGILNPSAGIQAWDLEAKIALAKKACKRVKADPGPVYDAYGIENAKFAMESAHKRVCKQTYSTTFHHTKKDYASVGGLGFCVVYGVDIFISQKTSLDVDPSELYESELGMFAQLIRTLCDLLLLSLKLVKIAYAPECGRDSFLHGGMIMMNFPFFLDHHAKHCAEGWKRSARLHWFSVLAHQKTHQFKGADHGGHFSMTYTQICQDSYADLTRLLDQP